MRRGGTKRARATDALVWRMSDYAETSAVVALLTADAGIVRAMAKGAKRLSNGFKGPLDRGVLYRVRFGRRGEAGLAQLHSAVLLEALPSLRREPARFAVAALVMEVAGDLMREGEPFPDLFRLAVFTLKVIDTAPPERLGAAAAVFLARAVELSGLGPELNRCVACGAELAGGGRPLLSAARGGVLHRTCGHGEPGARGVTRPLLDLMERIATEPPARALATPWPETALPGLRRILADWLEHVLERRFRTAAPMERELGRLSGPDSSRGPSFA